ncbi:MAG: DUF2066 domain-containing protein [Woeseia sp.]
MIDRTPTETDFVRRTSLLLVAAVLVLALPDSGAVETPALYAVQVPLDPEEGDPRAAAYKRGLWEVVVRVTGSELPAAAPLLDELFPVPSRYVLQFRQGPDGTLLISFDGAAIGKVLQAAGETVWGPDRPLTIVWLAVDWGQGKREIIAADDPEPAAHASRSIDRNRLLRERVQETASRRGIPVAFPLLDTEDLRNISFTDIWGGFDEPLLQASVRYQTNSILVGRVRPATLRRNRWTYYLGDQQQEWSGEPEDAINLLADSLAAEFAFSGNAPLETVTLSISGIDSVSAYGSVQRYLENLGLIEGFDVHTVAGDRIRYEVRLRGGLARLARALQVSDILIPVEDNDSQFPPFLPSDSLEFMYRAPGRDF